jgi:hypothetical protein
VDFSYDAATDTIAVTITPKDSATLSSDVVQDLTNRLHEIFDVPAGTFEVVVAGQKRTVAGTLVVNSSSTLFSGLFALVLALRAVF